MESVSEVETKRIYWQWLELSHRYWHCWIAAEGRWPWPTLDGPRSAEAVEPWIDAITGLSEAVLREDLEKVDHVLNLHSKFNLLNSLDKAFLETLKGKLLPQRLTALASLRQTELPEAVEVLGLLLRELWARITGGHSKLCDQETAHLQRLLDLMQKTIADWDRVKNPNQIEWCGHFCGAIWALQQSGGRGSPARVDYDVALEELRDLVEKVRNILTSRQPPVDQPHQGSAEPASEAATEAQRFRRQWHELLNWYEVRWIEEDQHVSSTLLEWPRRAEDLEPWIDAVIGVSEALLREDLEKVDHVLNLASKWYKCNYLDFNAFLLKGQLQERSGALASLKETGIPEAVEVLGLMLRELSARITGGNSKLCDQETAQLQRLLDLVQKAIADWDRVKNPNQIDWCGHFCGPIWALRQSRGDGPPGPVYYKVALEDLRGLKEKVQGILLSRPALRQDLNEFKDLFKDLMLSLKEEVKELKQDKLQMKEELERLKSEKMTDIQNKVQRIEQECSADRDLQERLQREILRVKDESHQLKNEQMKMNEDLQQAQNMLFV